MPALDLAPPPAPANNGSADAGFEVAVREVAAKAGEREKPGPASGGGENGAVRAKPDSGSSSSHQATKAKSGKDDAAEDAAPREETAQDLGTTPAADLLGRLLLAAGLVAQAGGGKASADGKGAAPAEPSLSTLSQADAAALAAVALAAAPEEGTTFDGALEERLVITPLGAGAAEAAASGKTGGAGGVGLEVLHIKTHFEPRVDDVVLVEGGIAAPPPPSRDGLDSVLSSMRRGAGAAGAASNTGQSASASTSASVTASAAAFDRGRASSDALGPTTRFDETLARLSTGEGAGLRQDGETERRDGREDRRSARTSIDEGRRAAARSDVTPSTDVETASMIPIPAAGSMTGQIADRIIDAFRPASGGQRPADLPSEATHLRLTAGGAALKTLTIQLQPENLGKLEVSMRLVDGRLTLELAASSAETAVALGNDRAGLKKLLEHAGFSMDEASISIVSRDSAAQMTRAGAASDANGSTQQGPSGEGQRSANGSASGERGFERGSGSGGQPSSRDGHRPMEGMPEAQKRRGSSTFL
ncbi:hypothetical protein ASG43_12845 [Aureimonas sp. Leaf454]|uniref:flagellar hook-length control protein FliK n=1 Tax=Aureimonas sp. Leaf454 TaxID=1736381 RepID=UPI0006FD25D2|nr:flagellar hook-length control protein FliK [Aureimonas sp. Leaf454]KQT45175.1 hypothetical protein ASG43_12845 [Aureimonas sp. Leaf454]